MSTEPNSTTEHLTNCPGCGNAVKIIRHGRISVACPHCLVPVPMPDPCAAIREHLASLTQPPEVDDWKTLIRLAYADGGDGVLRIYRITAEYNRVREQIAEMERQRENVKSIVAAECAIVRQQIAECDERFAALTAERDKQKAIAGEIREELRITKRILAIEEEQSTTLKSTLRDIAAATSEPGIAARVQAVLPVEARDAE